MKNAIDSSTAMQASAVSSQARSNAQQPKTEQAGAKTSQVRSNAREVTPRDRMERSAQSTSAAVRAESPDRVETTEKTFCGIKLSKATQVGLMTAAFGGGIASYAVLLSGGQFLPALGTALGLGVAGVGIAALGGGALLVLANFFVR